MRRLCMTSGLAIAVIGAAAVTGCGDGSTTSAAEPVAHSTVSTPTSTPTSTTTSTVTGPTRSVSTSASPDRPVHATDTTSPSTPTGEQPHPTGHRQQDVVLNNLPGSKRSSCVQISDQRDVRSGPIAMGNFAGALAAYHAAKGAYDAPPLNFYVIPESLSAGRVTVTMTPVTAKAKAQTLTSDQVESAGQWKYFALSVNVPAPGTWRFTAVSGGQRGCFQVTFTA
jgi:hypothetical protein